MYYIYIILVLSSLLTFSSCRSNELPQGIISETEMVDLLTDVFLLEGYYADETMYHFDSMPVQIRESYDELFQKYGITQQIFDTNMLYYMHRPETFTSIQQQVLDRLDKDSPDNK